MICKVLLTYYTCPLSVKNFKEQWLYYICFEVSDWKKKFVEHWARLPIPVDPCLEMLYFQGDFLVAATVWELLSAILIQLLCALGMLNTANFFNQNAML